MALRSEQQTRDNENRLLMSALP
eukprot:COSAG06_NODE_25843_length_627_cov_1.488636_2_plen_22_part_01